MPVQILQTKNGSLTSEKSVFLCKEGKKMANHNYIMYSNVLLYTDYHFHVAGAGD